MADYFPKTDAEKLAFMQLFSTALTTHGANVGVTSSEIAATNSMKSGLQAVQNAKAVARAAAEAATAECASLSRTIEDNIRPLVRRIKAHPAYTPAIGQALGIEGPEASGPAIVAGASPRPDLEAAGVLFGQVELRFAKGGFTGVEIECMRGTETVYNFLARDTECPYVDTRANLTDGPETRRYRARYLKKDQLVGEYSDVLVVTVPARA